jgi:hypothetical protein
MRNGDYVHSSYREHLIEHLFLGELLSHLWLKRQQLVEVLRADVDASGYDVVLVHNGVTRHVQLKTRKKDGRARKVPVNMALAKKEGGCVIWIFFAPDSLDLGPYLWFGGKPEEGLPSLEKFKRYNERDNIRAVPLSKFEEIEELPVLIGKLFG